MGGVTLAEKVAISSFVEDNMPLGETICGSTEQETVQIKDATKGKDTIMRENMVPVHMKVSVRL